jgi:hypothetical protein
MSTPRRAAQILDHYFRQMFELNGLTWTRENQADIIELVKGFAASPARNVPPAPHAPAAPTVPPARPATGSETVNIKHGVDAPPTWLQEGQ